MKKVEGYFWFSFGGNADIGECHRIGNTEKIDFPSEHEAGYGAALRNGIEVDDFSFYKSCKATVVVNNPLTVTAEYPANKSTYPKDIILKVGENIVEFELPENCAINEVKLFISNAKNHGLEKTEFSIISWEFVKIR